MKSSATSFISEHTAEYILVPDLVRRLGQQFPNIIPMFFWSTREGSIAAMQMMSGVSVRVITAFGRRPKTLSSQPDLVTMKVNQQLLEYTRASVDTGIPVVAGIPLVSSLLALRMDSPCCWYDLQPFSSCHGDCFLKLALDGSVVSTIPPQELLPEQLRDPDLLNLVDNSAVNPWEIAVEKLRDIRRSRTEYTGFPFFGGYKPFHVVLLTRQRRLKNQAKP